MVKAKLKQLDEEKEFLEKEINALQEELAAVAEKRDKTFVNIQEIRKQREESVCIFSYLALVFNYDNNSIILS